MTHCPKCHQLLRRSEGGGGLSSGWPEGTVILVCLGCQRACIEGDGRWASKGPGTTMMDALHRLADAAKRDRDTVKDIMTSDIQ